MKNKIEDLNKDQLSGLLKISDPLLMIDKLIDIVDRKSGCGVKNIKIDEWFYKSHFIDDPVMPGVLQIEAMLQTIVAILYSSPGPENHKYLVNKTSTNFYSKINKSGELIVKGEIIKEKNGVIEAKANILFNNEKVSDGTFRFLNPTKLKI